MSAYSDYKCGAIDYEEFKSAMAWECRGDNDYGCRGCKCSCEDCIHYVEGTETECDLPEGECVDKSEFEPVDYPDY